MSVLCVEAGINNSCVLAAAALHDTIEHTETTPAELEAEFGSQIASIVAEMTDDKALPKAERKQLQIERASHKSREAAFVKLLICGAWRQARPRTGISRGAGTTLMGEGCC